MMSGETAVDRSVYALSGADVLTFLQGMLTNDVLPLARSTGIVWSALLTPQGKYLADFFVVHTADHLLLDIKTAVAEAAVRRLLMYRLRADAQIVRTDLHVTRGLGPAPDDAPDDALRDPRHPSLGWRAYGAPGHPPQIDWDAIRVAATVPETGIELTADTFILEARFEALNGVDFRKGCYVGQEVTARMKHKTELRKGLVRVGVAGSAPIGTEILADGKPAGTLYTQSGGFGIAYLRHDRAGLLLTAGEAVVTLI